MKAQFVFEALMNLTVAIAFALLILGITYAVLSFGRASETGVSNSLSNTSDAINSSIPYGFGMVYGG
jgi:hypothetical protein